MDQKVFDYYVEQFKQLTISAAEDPELDASTVQILFFHVGDQMIKCSTYSLTKFDYKTHSTVLVPNELLPFIEAEMKKRGIPIAPIANNNQKR